MSVLSILKIDILRSNAIRILKFLANADLDAALKTPLSAELRLSLINIWNNYVREAEVLGWSRQEFYESIIAEVEFYDSGLADH